MPSDIASEGFTRLGVYNARRSHVPRRPYGRSALAGSNGARRAFSFACSVSSSESTTLFSHRVEARTPSHPLQRGNREGINSQTIDNGPRTASKSCILCLSSLLLRFRSLFDIGIPFVASPAPTRAPSGASCDRCAKTLRAPSATLAFSIAVRSTRSADRTASMPEPISAPYVSAPSTSSPFLLSEHSRSLLSTFGATFPLLRGLLQASR